MFFFISFLFPWLLSILFSGVLFPFLFWNPLCRLSILCVVVLVSYYNFILETVYWQCVSISISTIYIMFCCRFPITLLFWNLFIYFYVYCLYCVLMLVSYYNLILESCISISMSSVFIVFWCWFPITILFLNLYICFYVHCLYCVFWCWFPITILFWNLYTVSISMSTVYIVCSGVSLIALLVSHSILLLDTGQWPADLWEYLHTVNNYS